MRFRDTATLTIELAGTETNQFDLLSVSGPATLNGTLAINLLDNFRPAAGDSFAVLKARSIEGAFANAANGQRLATIDGFGSFIVNYSATNLVLTAFEANQNPPPTAPAQLLSPTFGLRAVEVTLTGSPGRDYVVQTSTNLLGWLTLLTNNAGFDGRLLFELPASEEPYRFFRATVK